MWQARCFDIVAIVEKSRPSDMKDHDVLGKTYRVSLLTTGNKGEKGIKRRSALQISSAVQKKPIALASPAEAADTSLVAAASASTDNDNGEDIDGSSSSDTTSSTSSSLASDRKKKHKKHKKSKKNKKQEKKRNHVKNGKKDKKNRDRKADKKPETPAEIRANVKQAKACEKEEIKRKNDKKKGCAHLGKAECSSGFDGCCCTEQCHRVSPCLDRESFPREDAGFQGLRTFGDRGHPSRWRGRLASCGHAGAFRLVA